MKERLLAESVTNVVGGITPPASISKITSQGGAGGLSLVISNIIAIIIVFGGIAFVFMFLLGIVEWILSGGDKERLAQARSRILYAVIGIILLSVSFVILQIIGSVTGIQVLNINPSLVCDPSGNCT